MSKHLAIQPGQLYPQPDYTIQIDQENKWTVTQVYLCHSQSILRVMPKPGLAHPEVSFATLANVTAAVGAGEIAEITCTFIGAGNKNEKADATYTMGLSLSEEPILKHYRYKDLADDEVEALKAMVEGKDKDDSGAAYKDRVKSELGKEVLKKIQRGQTSFYSPKVTWRESWTRDNEVKNSELNKIGEVDNPSGNPPDLSGGRTWLLNGVTQTHEGKSFRIEREWLASDQGGWDEDIYKGDAEA
jgi:hypothetical protein